jgi:hypothetical protein
MKWKPVAPRTAEWSWCAGSRYHPRGHSVAYEVQTAPGLAATEAKSQMVGNSELIARGPINAVTGNWFSTSDYATNRTENVLG